MRILFIADGRSPIATNWIDYFIHQGYEVHLASTYPVKPELDLASLHVIHVAFSKFAGTASNKNLKGKGSLIKRFSTTSIRTRIRQWLGPLTLPRAAKNMRVVINEIQPDLVHALRIPFEGMLAAQAKPHTPLVISVWGNDFTFHASATPLMAYYTRKAIQQANALIPDCQRDLRLARQWGYPEERPSIVLIGAGGLQLDTFYPPKKPVSSPVVINPRGLRAYVRNDTFFQAIPIVLARRPETRFICPAMKGEPQAEKWVTDLGITELVEFFPRQSHLEMADLFRQASVVVSPSEHDGTPNSLLEGMACGCFPVAGNIESVREWISHGENGLLIDPADPHALAQAILTALDDAELRAQAQAHNSRLVAEKAEYGTVMREAEVFYKAIVEKKGQSKEKEK